MRQIEKEMRAAVQDGRNWTKSNTRVESDGNSVVVYLHDNAIYREGINAAGLPYAKFSLAGWNTPTTRSRLQALGVDIRQRNWDAYRDGVRINWNAWYDV